MKRTLIDTSNMELTEKVVTIKRVTKVVKGGRNMRFTALVVVGDGNGHVGAGLGKATEIPEAIRKGKEDAIKNMVEVALDDNRSVTHDYLGKYGSATVLLKKAPEGTGIMPRVASLSGNTIDLFIFVSPIASIVALFFGTAPIGDFTKVIFNIFSAMLSYPPNHRSQQLICHDS